ncbi:hypothetical protein KSP39_PZI010774 [Platanthera zijinensis]|uniref:Uncharacterized protein n=1 Tax=Platanthera zijinensis TaxID=2320716 RepID=A0AAP0G701_9ASPA
MACSSLQHHEDGRRQRTTIGVSLTFKVLDGSRGRFRWSRQTSMEILHREKEEEERERENAGAKSGVKKVVNKEERSTGWRTRELSIKLHSRAESAWARSGVEHSLEQTGDWSVRVKYCPMAMVETMMPDRVGGICNNKREFGENFKLYKEKGWSACTLVKSKGDLEPLCRQVSRTDFGDS